jgi:hypothetical protein
MSLVNFNRKQKRKEQNNTISKDEKAKKYSMAEPNVEKQVIKL